MFSTWEQGFEISPAECLPVQKRQGFTECTGRWSRGDRTLGSSVRSIIKEDGTLGLRSDASDRTLAEHCSASGHADMATHREDGE